MGLSLDVRAFESLRGFYGLSMEQFALLLGISRQAYSNMIHGLSFPSGQTLINFIVLAYNAYGLKFLSFFHDPFYASDKDRELFLSVFDKQLHLPPT